MSVPYPRVLYLSQWGVPVLSVYKRQGLLCSSAYCGCPCLMSRASVVAPSMPTQEKVPQRPRTLQLAITLEMCALILCYLSNCTMISLCLIEENCPHLQYMCSSEGASVLYLNKCCACSMLCSMFPWGCMGAASPWRTLGIRSSRTFCSDLAW